MRKIIVTKNSPLSITTKDLGKIYTPSILAQFISPRTITYFLFAQLNKEFPYGEFTSENILDIFDQFIERDLRRVYQILRNIKIIDPTVGSGNLLLESYRFLVSFFEYLKNKGIEKRSKVQFCQDIVQNNLFGVYISKTAINNCKESFLTILPFNNRNEKIKFNLFQGDALISHIDLQTSDSNIADVRFNWKEKFPKIMEKGGFDVCIINPPWNIHKPLEKEFFSNFDEQLSKYNVDKQEARKIIERLLNDPKIKEAWILHQESISQSAKWFKRNFHYQSSKIQIAKRKKNISGDLNLYKLFVERVYNILNTNGFCGMIVPSGIHTDAGTKGLRNLIFDQGLVKELISFENKLGIFPSVHRSFKFDTIIYQKTGHTSIFLAAFMQSIVDSNEIFSCILHLDWNQLKIYSPSSWSIMEFKSEKDIEITKKMYMYPPLSKDIPNSWKFRLTRELDVTINNNLFNQENKGYAVYEGKMIEQYNNNFAEPRYWIMKNNIPDRISKKYGISKPKLAFRSIAASTNRRTMIATILPNDVLCANSLTLIKSYNNEGIRIIKEEELYYLCGIFNSFIFDYLLRLKVTTNINMFFIYDMPVPRASRINNEYLNIIENVKQILVLSNDPKKEKDDAIEEEISKLKSNIELNVLKLYKLDNEDLNYILETFQRNNSDSNKTLTLIKKLLSDCHRSES